MTASLSLFSFSLACPKPSYLRHERGKREDERRREAVERKRRGTQQPQQESERKAKHDS